MTKEEALKYVSDRYDLFIEVIHTVKNREDIESRVETFTKIVEEQIEEFIWDQLYIDLLSWDADKNDELILEILKKNGHQIINSIVKNRIESLSN